MEIYEQVNLQYPPRQVTNSLCGSLQAHWSMSTAHHPSSSHRLRQVNPIKVRKRLDLWSRVTACTRTISICFPHTCHRGSSCRQPADQRGKLFGVRGGKEARRQGGKEEGQFITLVVCLGCQTRLAGVTLLNRCAKASLGPQGVD